MPTLTYHQEAYTISFDEDENKFEYPDKSGNGIAIATPHF